MPIKIPDALPARSTLEAEGVMVMSEADAGRQDIRPMRIGLLNLMPNKVSTETQLARLLGATPLQIELTLVRITDHVAQNTPLDHMEAFYRPWAELADARFDGFVITGAPVERLAYEDVRYWPELQQIFDWTQSNLVPSSPFLRGFSDDFAIPVSRWTEVRKSDLPRDKGLRVLAESEESGLCLLEDPGRRALHMFNHVEYDTLTLGEEYTRDGQQALPVSYFPGDDPRKAPENRWRSHAHLLFGNWINVIYQTTPFDVAAIGTGDDFGQTG